jgi:K(+)-stimulated pyrophosphate-energized sodium pump
MEGTGKPEYDKCVAISTQASIKKMMLPGAITIVSPIIIGFGLGAEALGGFLAGATVSGVLMGIFQNNAGGAWDNAKKSFEKGANINGVMYYKGSEPHKASVTGDTVGDPFKDTSGPSMNILIKLMSIVSLVIAPSLAQISANQDVEPSIGMKDPIEQPSSKISGDKNDEYQALRDALWRDGVFSEANNSLRITGGIIYVDEKPLDPAVAAKYEDLLRELLR